MSIEINFPIGGFCGRSVTAQIVRCLFQDTYRQTFFRRGRCRFGWRSNKMAALGIAGVGIQKRSELLARHSRKGHVSASETVGKHHELTRELRCFSNTFVQYQIHHISLFELIRFILSKDFELAHFKKFDFFVSAWNLAPEAHCQKVECAPMLAPGHARPYHVRPRGRAGSICIGFWHRCDIAMRVTPFAYGCSSTL